MAGIFKASDFVFDREVLKDLSQAIYESGFAKPEINLFHTVVEGIVYRKQLAIIGRLEGLMGAGNGGCDPVSSNNQFGGADKTWTPVNISDRLEQCWIDLDETFWAWGLKQGIAKSDLDGTDFFMYVTELMKDVVIETIYRLVWFNDVDADTVANLGQLTNGTPLVYFNKLNGFFRQIDDIVATDPARLTLGLDTKNGQASYALQEFNSADVTNKVVSNTLQKVRFKADTRLRAKTNLKYITTLSVADQYEAELTNANVNYTTERLENGIVLLKSGGIEVYAFEFWDRIIRQYYDDGVKLFRPHRILLMSPDNFQVGVETAGSLTEFDVFQDKKDKKNYIDFMFKIDAKIGLDHELQVAY